MWEGILALLRFFLRSFLLKGSYDDKSSTFEDKREMEIKETVQVSENTVNFVSAPRNLLARHSAYDTLQTSFSQNPSINPGDQSERSVPKFVNKPDYEGKLSSYSPCYKKNVYFTPTNIKRITRSPDHVTHQYETMEDSLGTNFRDSREFKRRDFAVHSSENESMRPEFGLDRESEMNLKFHDRSDDFSDFSKSAKRFRKHKEPNVYNGENVEWPDYLCHFEQVSLWNEWSR